MRDRIEIVASGFGGQGVVRLGQILGQAGVRQGLHVTMLKSHGTEMRGGYVRSQVVLSRQVIDSPMCENPDYLIALSSAAYTRFKDTVPGHGLIVYDPAFIEEVDGALACRQLPVPAKDLSMKRFSRPMFANTIIIGLMARDLGGVIDREIVLESMLSVIPKFREDNQEAFELGFNFQPV